MIRAALSLSLSLGLAVLAVPAHAIAIHRFPDSPLQAMALLRMTLLVAV